MNADNKYKSAIDGVSFSPDFEINLKRRLRGETLIKMEPTKRSPLRTVMLAGMSVAACFLCFFAVKFASERPPNALVSEPVVTAIETEYTSYNDETSVVTSSRQGFAAYGIPAPGGSAAVADEADVDDYSYSTAKPEIRVYETSVTTVIIEDKTYRPAVALEGLLAAFDSGTFGVFSEEGVPDFVNQINQPAVTPESFEVGEGIADSEANSVTVTTDYVTLDSYIRAYLEKIIESGSKNCYAEYKTGVEQYRIDINGSDGTLLYSIWAFDNCVLVERFAPDGLMKCYIEVSE
jgi:hypothetical protein